jgi:hypothetical protein
VFVEGGTDGKISALVELNLEPVGAVVGLKGIANGLTGNFRIGIEITTDFSRLVRWLIGWLVGWLTINTTTTTKI